MIVQSQVNKYLKSDEFKGKIFKQSTCFYTTGFNNGLRSARESPIVPLSSLCTIEYDSDGEEVQYGPNDRALPKVYPPAPHGVLAHLAAKFDQGTSQVGDGPHVLEVVNTPLDPPLKSDTVADLTIDVLKNTSKVEPDLASDLASS